MAKQIHFRVHRTELLSAMTAANEAVSAKSKIPILENVMLQPVGDRLVVRGTDLNIDIQTHCDLLQAESTDGFTVSSDDLYRIVKSLPESSEITFEAGKFPGQVAVAGGSSRFNLHYLPASDYPSMGEKKPPYAFTVTASLLSEAFGKILFAVNTTMPQRAYFMGAHIHITEAGKLGVVGCDGLKLAVCRITPQQSADFENATIPTATVKAFCKLLGSSKALCEAFIDENKIVLECEDIRITSRLVEGVYPKYDFLISNRQGPCMRADRDAFSRAITRATIISNDEEKEAIRLSVVAGSVQIELATTDGQSAAEALQVDYDGDEYIKGFNGSFLSKALSSVSTTSFRIYGTDPSAPGHITPDNDADEDYIVMPMRV